MTASKLTLWKTILMPDDATLRSVVFNFVSLAMYHRAAAALTLSLMLTLVYV